MSMLMACDVVSVVRLPSFVRRPDSLSDDVGDDVVFVLCGICIFQHTLSRMQWLRCWASWPPFEVCSCPKKLEGRARVLSE